MCVFMQFNCSTKRSCATSSRSSSPTISIKVISFPSLSVPIGSDNDNSISFFLSLRSIIRSSLSIHLAAYVASLIFLSGSNVFTAFIRPIVPTDIRSSVSLSADIYFLIICATRRIFFSTSILRAFISPF